MAQAAGIGPTLTYTGNGGTSLIWDENATLVSTTNNQPRFDHDPVTGAALGLLIEEARENLLLRSEEFDNAYWSKNGTSVTANQAVAPDGTTTADLFTADDGTNDSVFRVVSGVDADSKYTLSAWIALAPGSDTPSADSNVNLVLFGDLVATVSNNIGSDVTSSLQRFSITATTDGAPTNFTAQVGLIQGGDSGVKLLVWGAQVEKGAVPTSYIPTATGTVTRTADVLSTTDLTWLNGSAGTMFVQGSIPFAGAAERSLFTIDDGTATDRLRLYMDAAENVNFETVNSADTNGASDGAAVIAGDTTFKAAGAYADDDVIGVVDGTASSADSAAGIPVTDAATTMRIGNDSAGTPFNGHIAQIKYWDVRKTNAFLQAVTV